MAKLSGKIAAAGGKRGIRLATAKHFVAKGAFVYITGRRQASLAGVELFVDGGMIQV